MRQQLQARKLKGSLRTLKQTSTTDELHDFSSNDYLDLSTSTVLRGLYEGYMRKEQSLASTGSRLLSGNNSLVGQIEAEAKHYWKSEEALVCSSGYEANVSIFNCLPQPGDTIIYDELIHASVHVGMKNSRATHKAKFRHNDLVHLAQLLRSEASKGPSRSVFIAIETVYSMDGDLAPLLKILKIIRRECPWARLVLDEAHATGIFGDFGQGLAFELGLHDAPEILLRLHTFGKGAAGTGAVIVCDALVKQYLLNYAKGLIYSTFMAKPALCLARASLKMLSSGQARNAQEALLDKMRYTQKALNVLSHSHSLTLPSQVCSPVIPVLTPQAVELSSYLQRQGFRVLPVRYPTVAKGRERLRICLRSNIDHKVIDDLISAMDLWVTCEDLLDKEKEKSVESNDMISTAKI
ncbi:protein of unknown function [Taphrina deformans PYCC 5710]|uniref:Aminotransferase class I/classII large domain-containing protein n=1 Tax=Taphrina deformans (strain PYCC 5710 / ATCC 11124 / CBS 356.35 / IMI 108563 / JCM 9778 / NBRC 8474) TaxID=1097556 RepID=R4XFT0_TAPDE|nr:protein of unknown function [Taphrina deformans PYCC 5710]|eukprot:CCG84605.1 protein of unknown function [Taphrina deformans PYCC 5710]